MTEEQQKKELEIALTTYIALKHTQEECIGFIDGFKEALRLFAVSGNEVTLPSELKKELIKTGYMRAFSQGGRFRKLAEQQFELIYKKEF